MKFFSTLSVVLSGIVFGVLVPSSGFAQTSVISGQELEKAMKQFSGAYIEIGGAYQSLWKSSVTNGTYGIRVDTVSQLAIVNTYCQLNTVSVTNSDRLGTLFYCLAK